MNLHNKQQFIIAIVANTPYTEQEALLFWDMLNTDSIDLIQALYSNMYAAGYKACLEDKMCS